ncbi:acyl-CoA dehydrogenase family protein [Streptomyces zingiberis]|uniref:acyl-CoA dehydrogenase family protein n=1 Tax=Streptomyces zingiberis TaxID=2053010 RepID=UPI0019CFFB7C
MTVIEPAAGEPAGHDHWLQVAREVADDLATDAASRERAGHDPSDEVARFREAGLLTLLIPSGHGGGGAGWPTACAVVREIAAADGTLGLLLGRHYVLSWSPRSLTGPGPAARIERRSAAGQWFWGGGLGLRETPPVLAPDADGHGWLLEGRQDRVAGARVADRLAVAAVRHDTGEPLFVLVDPAGPGVVAGPGEETFGLRQAAAGSVEFAAVPLAGDAVLGSLSADGGALPPCAGLTAATGHLVSAQTCLGLAQGMLAEARDHARSTAAAWPGGAPADPHTLAAYGELSVSLRAASALAAEAVAGLTGAADRPEDLTDDECAEVTVVAAAAESAAVRAAQEITARALDVAGAGSAAARHGLDRFWRDLRAHTLHQPAGPRLQAMGDHFLHGAYPPLTLPA